MALRHVEAYCLEGWSGHAPMASVHVRTYSFNIAGGKLETIIEVWVPEDP